MSTAERLREIEKRLEAATPGPFTYIPATRVVKQDGRDNSKLCTVAKWNDKQEHDDEILIAHAPSDIRFLVDALRVAVEQLQLITTEADREHAIYVKVVAREALAEITRLACKRAR